MKLDARIQNGQSSVQDFQEAAEERFIDAQDLLARGNGTGALYLCGYVAEMLLKSSVFLTDGAKPAEQVYPRLAPVKNWARRFLPHVPFTSYHSLLFWSEVLLRKRLDVGNELSPALSGSLRSVARRMHDAWTIELRYFGFQVDVADAKSFLEDVAWIRKNYAQSWSQSPCPS